MLADEANMQKRQKREEQIRKWREREMSEPGGGGVSTIESYDKSQRLGLTKKESKVKFPKGCVFLAACSSGDIDEVRQHLKMGVNINTTNIDGLTALHQACIDANLTMVQFLVEHGADVNAQDNEGWTPLHAAVSVGNLEVVKYLIGAGARLDACNSDSDLPVDLCDAAANAQMRDYLDEEMQRRHIDGDAEKRREEELMYEDAKEANFFDKVHNKTGATALHVSAAKGYLRVIKLLLQYNANVNEVDKDGWTPLHAAAHWEQEEACKLLVEHGASFDIKTYSGQTPFDVCDKEMAVKLKALQNKQQQIMGANNTQKDTNKLNDWTSNNNKLDARVRRVSDELNKSSSITRLTNEAKSSISEREKKQDKILLSPITTSSTVVKPHFDLFANSDSENDKINNGTRPMDVDESNLDSNHLKPNDDRFIFDKENLNRSNSYTNSTNSQGSNNMIGVGGGAGDQDMNRPQVLNKSNSLNKPKTGLQENLKSLSAQVKLKMDEDEINDKHISLKSCNSNGDLVSDSATTSPTISSNNNNNSSTNTTTNNTSSLVNNNNACSITSSSSSSNLASNGSTTTTTAITSNSNRPYSDRRWGNSTGQTEQPSTYRRRVGGGGIQNQISPLGSPNSDLQNPLSPNGEGARRYSTAPIASKDEQAELIRKQKAKLERHFRRSTQAVSYEDIKSAEATIKGTNSNPSTPTIVTSPPAAAAASSSLSISGDHLELSSSSSLNGPIPPSNTTSTTSFSFNNNNSPTTPTTPNTPQVSVNSPPISQQGVSSLTSLFGEMINKSSSSSSNLYGLGQQQQSGYLGAIPSGSSQDQSSTTTSSSSVNPPTTTSSGQGGGGGGGGGGEIAIANDIETDKLLNAIEKSKGFSDVYSTQAQMTRLATARLRNRAIPFGGSSAGGSNDRFQPKSVAAIAAAVENDTTSRVGGVGEDENRMTSSHPQQLSPNNSNAQIRRINSGTSIETNNQSGDQQTSSAPQTQRQMYRFGQNPASDHTNIPTSSSITHLSTPTATAAAAAAANKLTSSASTTSAAAAAGGGAVVKRSISQVPSSTTDKRGLATNGTDNSMDSSTSSKNNLDFQNAYELMKKENEHLNQTIQRLQKELEDQNKDGGGLDKRERRALDRKISELEEEIKKIENLKQDNNRLKEENAALIRVISKLSK